MVDGGRSWLVGRTGICRGPAVKQQAEVAGVRWVRPVGAVGAVGAVGLWVRSVR